jgi:hypothetical protein
MSNFTDPASPNSSESFTSRDSVRQHATVLSNCHAGGRGGKSRPLRQLTRGDHGGLLSFPFGRCHVAATLNGGARRHGTSRSVVRARGARCPHSRCCGAVTESAWPTRRRLASPTSRHVRQRKPLYRDDERSLDALGADALEVDRELIAMLRDDRAHAKLRMSHTPRRRRLCLARAAELGLVRISSVSSSP